MRINLPNRLFISGFFILAVVILLILFTGWSTWINLNRDRANALQQLVKEAESLVYVIESDLRARMIHHLWSDSYLEKSFLSRAENSNIAYVYYATPEGEILFHYFAPDLPHTSVDIKDFDVSTDSQNSRDKIINLSDGRSVLEIKKSISVLSILNSISPDMLDSNMHTTPEDMDKHPENINIVTGLYVTGYASARKSDIHHAMIMMAIILSLGTGAVFFLFVIKKHLNDLKQIKRLEDKIGKIEKHAEIGKLAAAVAHEIRNPLSSIKGFAQFLAHLLKDDPQNCEYANIMVKELDRINRVITNLLTFARPLDTRKEQIDPEEFIGHIVLLVEADSAYKNITIKTDIQKGMESIYIDVHQMTQVLLNLVLNSLRELEPGKRVVIGAANDHNRCDSIIWVEDEGPGIAAEYQDKIFDPFFTMHEKGTGVGLSISKKIVESHGGEISVKSPLSKSSGGCRFTITLPWDNHLKDL